MSRCSGVIRAVCGARVCIWYDVRCAVVMCVV